MSTISDNVKHFIKGSTQKSLVVKSIIVAVFSVAVSCLLYYPLGALLPYLGIDNNNSFYINKYYNSINKSLTETKGQDIITVINTQHFEESSAREKIADVIEVVCKNNPLAIGVDIRFSSKKDSASDAKLQNAIIRNSDKIVLAQAYRGNTLLPSYINSDSLIYGITNLPDYYSYSPQKIINGKSYPLFSYQVLQIANPTLDIDYTHFIVNYSSMSFNPVNADDLMAASEDLQRFFVDNKVVLIGDTENPKDYHFSPFLIQGQEWTQGIFLHAYAIHSLLDKGNALHTLPRWINFVISFLLCFIFSMLFVLTFDRKTIDKCQFIKRHYPLYSLARPIFLLVADALIYFFFFNLITKPLGIIPDIVLYMISVLLINTFNDFVSDRINTNTHEEN